MLDGEEIDFCFDISFFKGLRIDHTLSSYRAGEHGGRVPDLVINVLSKSTWVRDVGEIVDTCRAIGIPVYVIFSPYDVASRVYKPPFLRVYLMDDEGNYGIHELREITLKDGEGTVNWNHVIDCKGRLPFAFGLMELREKHAKDLPLYRLVLLDVGARKVLPTVLEQEKARAEQEKARAEQEKARAEQEKARADKAIAELERLRNA